MHLELPSDSIRQRSFKIRAADSLRERNWAHLLVDRMYATRGYHSSAPADDESPWRKTFLASDHNSAVGTLTIGFESPDGLVVDKLFPAEVEQFRAAGQQVCEFTKLAMDRRVRSPRVLAALFHVAHIYAHRLKNLSTLLIEVNPRHVRYYETMLGFKVVAAERHNPRVNAPAVLLALDLPYAHEQIGKFGGKQSLATVERSAYPHFFPPEDEAGIASRLQRTDVDIASVSEVERVRNLLAHPGVPIH